MKKIFFDFDDVLFDTRQFKFAHIETFVDAGIPQDLYLETYESARERTGASNYQFEMHLKILHERIDFDEEALRQTLSDLTEASYKYIFSDVQESLQILREKGWVLYLVTFGTRGWQDQKVAGSGIDSFFEEVIVGEIDKGAEIAARATEADDAWFVDDRAEYLSQAALVCPHVKSILMQRPEGRFEDVATQSTDHCAASMAEVVGLISKEL